MGRGTARSPRATQCLITTIVNLIAHAFLLLVAIYYIAARDDIEIALFNKLVKDQVKDNLTDNQISRRVKGIKGRVETGALTAAIFSVLHISVLAAALFVILKKTDASLVRSYANAAGILFFLTLLIFQITYVVVWHGGFFELMNIMYWICMFACAANITGMEMYRRELVRGGNVGGRNRGWATPRPEVEANLSAANVNGPSRPCI